MRTRPAVTIAHAATTDRSGSGLRSLRLITIVLAFACGASVANLYYSQPLLDLISRAFAVDRTTATFVVTATQIGYAVGLATLLPLGDLLENRKLASRTLVATAGALLLAGFAPDFWVFLAASVAVAITSVVAQILIPLAAHLAPPESRGKFVGQVTTGLLLGIMLARSVSSFAAAAWGWRSIYIISAALMLLTSIALFKLLPRRQPVHTARYGTLLVSVVTLARTEPMLRRRAASQACLFGAFTAFWTAIGYELIDRHHFTQAGVALFALVGAAGAIAAPVGGRLGDAGHGTVARLTALGIGVAALALAGFGASNVYLLAAAGVLLDLAVQSHQVLSLREIYSLSPDARARVNAVYMITVFVGGAAASAITAVVQSKWGWTGVTVFAGILPLISVAIWLQERRSTRRHASQVTDADVRPGLRPADADTAPAGF
ncbi:Predicted arabinose efflux permease, MFS family [Nakamurella panacisegetis]|uniref:Predicted arabinose efflux permease, MFS family n=1 Tax=Nakamurella panacisegetis TaxID=1090615 RepID=A0A1H0LD82_9ACTN|nr:MFS transporter [Nakamurella panacisegetis]SDO66184.1 Predicted arabinose efflux permease, MFS family [Nakamurella panacisegetis]